MHPRRSLLSLTAVLTLTAATGTSLAVDRAETSAAGPSVVGIDVSRYQHPGGAVIDWRAVRRSGQSFVFIKATEGTTVRNAHFATDWRDSRSAGLYRGAYHFARPNRAAGSAAAQADAFLRVIGNQVSQGTLPPVLDIESNDHGMRPSEMVAWASAFLSRVEQRSGRRPIVYSYPAFWNRHLAGKTTLSRYPLWIAHYTSAAQPRTPNGAAWTFWQHTSSGRVPGVRGEVDRNRFRGNPEQLAVLALDGRGPGSPGAPGGGEPEPVDLLEYAQEVLDSLLSPEG